MKGWTWLLTTGTACGLLIAPMQTARADEPGWGLALKSPHLGTLFLYVTPQVQPNSGGFALVYPKTGAKFVMHAPSWKVVMYNDKTKTYYVESLDDLKQYGKGKTVQEIKQHAKLNSTRKGTTAIVAGAKATQYFINASSNSGPKQVEAWITSDIAAPRQLGQLLGKLFDVDTSNFPPGLPLRVKIADDSGKKDTLYETMKIEPQKIKTSSFTYPATYKHVNSELEVAVDEASRKKMESILEDSDELTTLLGTDSKPPASYGRSSDSANTRPSYVSSYSASSTTTTAKQDDWWANLWNSIMSFFGWGKK